MEALYKVVLFLLIFPCLVIAQNISLRISPLEWHALLELRGSLGISGKDWQKKVNPCSDWTGIECRNGYVNGINLSGLRRTKEGKLNPRFAVGSLQRFSMLSHFNSSGFLLPGLIPEWFGLKLSNLEVLDLSYSSVYGAIPPSLGSLHKLRLLCLSGNSFTSMIPAALGKLVSLAVLDLSRNTFSGSIPAEIGELKNLVNLDLSSNFLSGAIPPGLGLLSSLTKLNLSNNSLTASIPSQLGNLTMLMELDLGYNSLMGSLPEELGGLRSLRKMLIRNNVLEGSLSDGLCKNLSRLEYLSISGNSFDGTLPNAIWSMPLLKYLDLSYNNITGDIPSLISSVNVSREVFNASHNLFYGNLSSMIGMFYTIDVSNNYFQGSAPNDQGSSIVTANNCFLNLPGQRSLSSCQKFYLERSLIFGNGSVSEPMKPWLAETRKKKSRVFFVVVGLFGGLGVVVILVAGSFLLRKICNVGGAYHERSKNVSPALEAGDEKSLDVPIGFSGAGETFSYEQMLQATCNFSDENLIKHGHSGNLYRGTLEGLPVVVKRVDLHSFEIESLLLELEFYSKVMHPSFVPFVGHCLEQENVKMLVYKFMPNGDLSSSLRKLEATKEDAKSLDWITRLKIAIRTAEALCYLHHESLPPLVHGDIQTSSILLDDKYEVRLGSLSEICAPGADNSQNMISRLLLAKQNSGKRYVTSLAYHIKIVVLCSSGRIKNKFHIVFNWTEISGSSSVTYAYDVYCFGKVLLELVSGQIGISKFHDADTKQWLNRKIPSINMNDKEAVIKIIDESLIIEDDLLEEVWAVAIVAKSCLNPKASRRPSMRHVLKALENPCRVVRQESFSSTRPRRATSSRSLASAFYGSWHRSSSESSSISCHREIICGLTQERAGSRGSGTNDRSSSLKRSSSDVFPEPVEIQDVEKLDESS